MNKLAFSPNFRAMSMSFLPLQYLPKLYKKSEAVIRLDREEKGRRQAEAIDTDRRRITPRFDKS